MEVLCFAIFITLASIPWSSGEEKLLYETPKENLWGGWEALPRSPSSVIIFIVFSCTHRLLAPQLVNLEVLKIVIKRGRIIKKMKIEKINKIWPNGRGFIIHLLFINPPKSNHSQRRSTSCFFLFRRCYFIVIPLSCFMRWHLKLVPVRYGQFPYYSICILAQCSFSV